MQPGEQGDVQRGDKLQIVTRSRGPYAWEASRHPIQRALRYLLRLPRLFPCSTPH